MPWPSTLKPLTVNTDTEDDDDDDDDTCMVLPISPYVENSGDSVDINPALKESSEHDTTMLTDEVKI